MGGRLIIILLLGILLVNGVYASEFSITSVTKQSSGTPYRGDPVSYKGIIQADSGNVCKIECSYQVGSSSGSVSDNGVPPDTQLSAGQSQEFPFNVQTSGSSPITLDLIISCKQVTAWNCWSGDTLSHSKQVSSSFLYPGDGTCTPSKEKCEDYSSFQKDNACSCQSGKECRPNNPNGNRNDLDEKGCQTYCGNNIVEKQYEKCNDCPDDVGKCDWLQCFTGSECEGKFCVHNKCSRLAYIIGDGYCDTNVGENCNSKQDCPCESNTHCEIGSPNADYKGCATWCGNNVCEASEQRICKADCNWCGDGTCESSESCSSCDVDCGVCKKATKEEELQRNTQTKDVQTKQTTQTANLQTETSDSIKNEQKTVSLFGKNYNLTVIVVAAIALIVLLGAVSFFIYKKIKSNKKDKHHAEKKHHEPKVTRCHKCNKKIDEDTKFCPHCGHKIE